MDCDLLNIWGAGQILAYSGLDGETDFDNGIVMRTAFEGTGFDIRLPEKGGVIRFDATEIRNGHFILTGDVFKSPCLKLAFIDTHHVLMEGEFEVESGNSTQVLSSGGKYLIGVKKHLKPALLECDIDRVLDERLNALRAWSCPENLTPNTRKTLMKTYSQLRTQFYSPAGEIKQLWTTPDRWPHRQMWLWDSVFHAIGIRHLDVDVARQALLSVFDLQREDGFISHCGYPGHRSAITQPPVLALGVKLIDEIEPDDGFIIDSYPKLKAYIEWDLENRDTDGAGLLEWYIDESETCRSGESGMDNSPRFDSATQLDATDFNAFISHECEIMIEFAKRIGRTEDVAVWRERHERFNRLINERLWNEKESFYFDFDVDKGERSKVMASSGFLPLICGAANVEQARHLADHVKNPETFGAALPIPSIAVRDTESYSKDMWRGPVWINLNWLIAYGFRRYGMENIAHEIVSLTTREIEKMYLKYGTLFEFFDDRREVEPPDLLRKAKNAPNTFHQVLHDYGWTGTLYIDMILAGN